MPGLLSRGFRPPSARKAGSGLNPKSPTKAGGGQNAGGAALNVAAVGTSLSEPRRQTPWSTIAPAEPESADGARPPTLCPGNAGSPSVAGRSRLELWLSSTMAVTPACLSGHRPGMRALAMSSRRPGPRRALESAVASLPWPRRTGSDCGPCGAEARWPGRPDSRGFLCGGRLLE